MFYGLYYHNLDNKGRLVIPSKMREELGERPFIMKGFDGALAIYQESAFSKLMEESQNLSFNKKNTRAYLRVQLSSVMELELDKLGRVLIPSSLLTKYHIGKEIVVLGAIDHIEIWDKACYEQYEKESLSSFEEIAEQLEKQ